MQIEVHLLILCSTWMLLVSCHATANFFLLQFFKWHAFWNVMLSFFFFFLHAPFWYCCLSAFDERAWIREIGMRYIVKIVECDWLKIFQFCFVQKKKFKFNSRKLVQVWEQLKREITHFSVSEVVLNIVHVWSYFRVVHHRTSRLLFLFPLD